MPIYFVRILSFSINPKIKDNIKKHLIKKEQEGLQYKANTKNSQFKFKTDIE